uniref:Uncharacterized protein n=1 Tax=Anguilla anguilla TaxID=7936 RepID=A0A0E9WV70_ANGAN
MIRVSPPMTLRERRSARDRPRNCASCTRHKRNCTRSTWRRLKTGAKAHGRLPRVPPQAPSPALSSTRCFRPSVRPPGGTPLVPKSLDHTLELRMISVRFLKVQIFHEMYFAVKFVVF